MARVRLVLALLAVLAASVECQQLDGLAAAAAQLRSQLFTVFTGSSGARAVLRRQLESARGRLRRSPPVPEPPPSTTALCKQNGHSGCERHEVATQDGYLLTVVRIPASPGATPVLLLHGDLASSDSWMMRKDNSNLGTVLHEAGYDVWLGNVRGSTHSRAHRTLNSSDPAFWEWSWHEMGMYDVPAMVDHVLARTGAASLHLIGHSMATSSILVFLGERPEYNAKVRLSSLMSPSIRLRRGIIRTTFTLASDGRVRDGLQSYLTRNQFHEIWPRSDLLHYIGDIFCMDDSPFINMCYAMYEEVLGKGRADQRLPDYLATFGAYHPGGTSFRCIKHFGATSQSGRFRPLASPNDPNPRDYNLTAISSPVALYYSANDGIIDPKDVDRLARILPKLHEKHEVPLKQFNHVDFMWAKDVRSLVYQRLVRNMKEVDAKVVATQERTANNIIR
ncbi:lipase 3-like [Frankliniella occidentalis]|uniref:Lipase 3-like n=1 Tax=Frankliniella occidentalis TaxID=133901 RepID=A0A6J1RSI2_FRAOC|nr:lipase 3-like [Frankliniella occidentalis]